MTKPEDIGSRLSRLDSYAVSDALDRSGLLGSDDGVVVIPREKEAEILDLARRIEETEGKIRTEILAGTPVRVARDKYGYHQLQRRER